MSNTPLIFISYSHKDRDSFNDLKTHLKPYISRGGLVVWDDTKIIPGDDWQSEIENALKTARVAVLLVSPDFIASDFIYENEFPRLLDAAQREGLKIIWVPLRSSSYELTGIQRYQAAHPPDRPLNNLLPAERDQAWVEICKKIERAYRAVRTTPQSGINDPITTGNIEPLSDPVTTPVVPPENKPTHEQPDPGDRNNNPLMWIGIGASALLVIVALVYFVNQLKIWFFNSPVNSSSSSLDAHISKGDRSLINDKNFIEKRSGLATVQEKENCIKLVKESESKAYQCFDKLHKTRKTDPEVIIYKSNLDSRQKFSNASPSIVAVVAPVNQDVGIHILQGVAQQQEAAINNGVNLQVIIADDQDQPDKAKNIAKKLSEDKDNPVIAVVGHYSSGATLAALPEYEKNEISIISPTSTSTELSIQRQQQKNKVFFRTVSSTKSEAEWLVVFAKDRSRNSQDPIKYKIINSPKKYPVNLVEQITLLLKPAEIIGDPLNISRVDLLSVLNNEVKDANYIALFPAGESDEEIDNAIDVIKRTKGTNKIVLGGNPLYLKRVLDNAKDAAVCRLIIAVDWFPNLDDLTEAQKKWGGGINYRAALSNDAALVIWKMIKEGGTNRQLLLQKLNTSSSVEGMTGKIKFDRDSGDREGSLDRRTLITVIPKNTSQAVGNSIQQPESNKEFTFVTLDAAKAYCETYGL